MQEDWVRLIRHQDDASRPPGRVVYTAKKITAAVADIAARLAERLDGDEPTLLILLKGGAWFGCDLVRALPVASSFDFIGVSSYGSGLATSGEVDFYHYRPARELLDRRPVVLVDDICDSGTTFDAVAQQIQADFTPSKLLTCVLVWREGANFTPDFYGFRHAGDEYLVGYGLGAGERYRSLSDIRVLENRG